MVTIKIKEMVQSYNCCDASRLAFDSPELLEIQRAGYYKFLKQGITDVLSKHSPIRVNHNNITVELVIDAQHFQFVPPEDNPRECILKMKTYSCKLYVKAKIVCKTISETEFFETREEWICIGHLPMMTKRGHFIINGAPRVVVHQIVRSPGIYFQQIIDKRDDNRTVRYYGDIIPYKGVWLRLQTNKKGKIEAKLKKGKKVNARMLYKCFKLIEKEQYEKDEDNLSSKFIDSVESQALLYTYNKLYRPTEDREKEEILKKMKSSSLESNADADKHIKIKRCFRNLYATFKEQNRYDLSNLGREKIDTKLNICVSKNQKQLSAADIKAASYWLQEMTKGKKSVDDIDHLQNRRVRTSGEMFAIQFEVGVERLSKFALYKLKEFLNRQLTNSEPNLRYEQGLLTSGKKKHGLLTLGLQKRSKVKEFVKDVQSQRKLDIRDMQRKVGLASSLIKGDSFLLSRENRQALSNANVAQEEIKLKDKRVLLNVKPAYTYANSTNILNLNETSTGNLDTGSPDNRSKSSTDKSHYAKAGESLFFQDALFVELGDFSLKELLSTKPINGALRELFSTNPLSQYMDQTNPLAEMTHKRRISSLGVGGISRESAGMAIRGIHPTHYGRICPIETPEGKNAGLVNSLAFYAKIDNQGFIKSPYFPVIKGQVQEELGFRFLSAMQESGSHLHLAPSDSQQSKNRVSTTDTVPVRVADNLLDLFKKINWYQVDCIGISPIQMISVATSLIPFLEHNDANRALMGSNMQRQAVPLMIPERPIVGTGLESLVLAESGHVLQSKVTGFVSYVSANKISIQALSTPFDLNLNKSHCLDYSCSGSRGNGSKSSSLSLVCKSKSDSLHNKSFNTPLHPIYNRNIEQKVNRYVKIKNKLLSYKSKIRDVKLGHKLVWRDTAQKNMKLNLNMIKTTSKRMFDQHVFQPNIKTEKIEKQALKSSFVSLKSSFVSMHSESFNIALQPKTFTHYVDNFDRSNQDTCLTQRALVKEGDWVQKGDILTDCSASDKGELSVGKNILVAYIPWEGFNFEDAIVISERLVTEHVYTSLHVERYDFTAQNVKQGTEWFTKDLPGISNKRVNNLNELGIAKIGSFVKEGDILVGKVRYSHKKPTTPYERLLCDILGENNFSARDSSLYVPKGVHARVIKHTVVRYNSEGTDQTGSLPSVRTGTGTGTRAVAGSTFVPVEPATARIVPDLQKLKLSSRSNLDLYKSSTGNLDLYKSSTGKSKGSPGNGSKGSPGNGSKSSTDKSRYAKARSENIGSPTPTYTKHMQTLLKPTYANTNNAGFTFPDMQSMSINVKPTPKYADFEFDLRSKSNAKHNPSPKLIHVFLGEKRAIQVGDKMSGRHGNKGVVSKILPRQDMPYLPDGTPVDIILNPLGVPSRMNVGQVLEALLGLAGTYLKQNIKITAFDELYGVEASQSLVFLKLYQARLQSGETWLFQVDFPGKMRLIDGRSGECFDQWITVGRAYMLKLIHMVNEKIHARATGPYALITQQPLRGRSQKGGQRLGEMEVWALEGYGAAYTLQELLTKKSDDMLGRKEIAAAILPPPLSVLDAAHSKSNMNLNKSSTGKSKSISGSLDKSSPGHGSKGISSKHLMSSKLMLGQPEIFKVLICELQALCLDVGVYSYNLNSFQRYFLDKLH